MEANMQLKELRIEAGLTQIELAEQIGCTQSELSRIEKGQRTLKVDRLLRLAKALGVPPTTLLNSQQAA